MSTIAGQFDTRARPSQTPAAQPLPEKIAAVVHEAR